MALINLRNALMAGKRLPYDAEVEYLRVDAVGPYIVIDGVTYCNAVGTYYAFTISSGGVVTHDLIPVRLGNTGYMYDRITNKRFGNAGTGDFVVGPDVVPVEYIESNGTQYINTGLRYFPDFDVSIEVPSGQRNATIYCDPTHILERIGYATPYWQISAGDRLQSSVSVYGFHRVQFKASALTIDGQAIGTISNRTWADGATCYIGFNGNSIYVYKLYGCQMWDINNNATRNYKPVRVGTGSTWEGAMIDTLTRRIYRNAGTGAFGYGNDLKYPIPAE
ncbi:MAG: hypothetical protein IIY62_00335 [Kiritimatiellae bacterium]|nr:hypothetical protein [Kiritimatiellia bacterium]